MSTIINGTSNAITFPDGTIQNTAATVFASGTALIFKQTAAPTGWTKVTTDNDAALRVVSGTASTGGSVGFTTAFASQAVTGTVGTSGATTLTSSQIPAHTHSYSGNTGTVSADHTHAVYAWPGSGGLFDRNNNYNTSGSTLQGSINSGSMSANHTHGFSGTTDNGTGGGGSHTHSGGTFTGTAINLAVKYVDVIVATKD